MLQKFLVVKLFFLWLCFWMFLEKTRFLDTNENRVIKWIGVALLLMSLRYFLNLYSLLVFQRFFMMIESYQGIFLAKIVLLPIIQGIQAIVLIFLSNERVLK